ncbi:MAG: exodeoxyribonuclease I [Bdellovibrio bacteriovorus]
MSDTFYWHDYETWGADPRRDRPCQFAGLRTDAELNPVGDPLVLYCRPAPDLLPQPEACLVTGITPQVALDQGLIEAEFAARIESELGRPGTCGVGYNSIRFDDEVTRNLLYRNLRDPYAREWRDGNSRWDLIDTLRLAHALRPEGIQWPTREDGTASFRLEDLTAANGIAHAGAHDALADVRATLDLARLLRRLQPRLFDYALTLRDKHLVRDLLARGQPLLHCSARYPATLGCIAPVLPVAPHPSNGNGVICFDLREDPALLLELPIEEIRQRLFTPAKDLPEGVQRIPLKTVHINRAPVLAPLATLTPDAAERWSIDPDLVQRRARAAAAQAPAIRERVQAAHRASELPQPKDPDLLLYGGGFLSDGDRRLLDGLHRLSPQELARVRPGFADPRLPEMLLRYRARNWPETLTLDEREAWDAYRLDRLTDPEGGGSITLDQYQQRLADLVQGQGGDPARLAILDALADWAEIILDAGD